MVCRFEKRSNKHRRRGAPKSSNWGGYARKHKKHPENHFVRSKVKLKERADILKISKGTVFKVVHENLSMKKLYSKWVPRLLTVEQKQQRIHHSERCLKLFTRNKKDSLRRYITMNETWIHHFTPELKRASAEWRGEGENRLKRPKTQQSAGKGHGLCILGHARNFAHLHQTSTCLQISKRCSRVRDLAPMMRL